MKKKSAKNNTKRGEKSSIKPQGKKRGEKSSTKPQGQKTIVKKEKPKLNIQKIKGNKQTATHTINEHRVCLNPKINLTPPQYTGSLHEISFQTKATPKKLGDDLSN